MSLQANRQLALTIEDEVCEKIKNGILDGTKKKDLLKDIAFDAFSTHFPENGSVIVEGKFLARQIFMGGLDAASDMNWSLEKTVKQLSQGLLKGLTPRGNDYISTACVLVEAAILSALLTMADIEKTCEKVLSVVFKSCEENSCDLKELKKKASRSAAKVAKSFPKVDTAGMQNLLFGLLDEKCEIDDSGCHWVAR